MLVLTTTKQKQLLSVFFKSRVLFNAWMLESECFFRQISEVV